MIFSSSTMRTLASVEGTGMVAAFAQSPCEGDAELGAVLNAQLEIGNVTVSKGSR